MIRLPVILCLLVLTCISKTGQGQGTQKAFATILQSYFLNKDTGIVGKTIAFLNSPDTDIREIQPLLIGFFGALFSEDKALGQQFSSAIPAINIPAYRQFFAYINSLNMDSFYLHVKPTTAYNDMNWSSSFATGNSRYIDHIVSQLPYAKELTDFQLFLTGQSARWSLCSNARKYPIINDHLTQVAITNDQVAALLKMTASEVEDETIKIIKAQRANGKWK